MKKMWSFLSVFFILIILSLIPVFAESYTLGYKNAKDPQVDGRYIVFLKDNGQGKFDVALYDSGNLLSTSDDIGESILAFSTLGHELSNPVIDGRYIAWLDNKKDIYLYDMGDNKIFEKGKDPGVRKLNIQDNNVQNEAGDILDYTEKNHLSLSQETLVWDDYDSLHGDLDVRGYSFISGKDFIVTTSKKIDIAGQEYFINEQDPFIEGSIVVYLAENYNDLGEFGVTSTIEVYEIQMVGTDRILSNAQDGCTASEPSVYASKFSWIDSCPESRIMKDRQVAFQDAGKVYHSPLSNIFDFYYSEGTNGDFLLSTGEQAASPNFDLDDYRLVYSSPTALGSDIGVKDTYKGDFLGSSNSIFLGIKSDGAGGAFVLSRAESKLFGYFISLTTIEKVEIGFIDNLIHFIVGYGKSSPVVLYYYNGRLYVQFFDGKTLGKKVDLGTTYLLLSATYDGKGGVILALKSKIDSNVFAQFVRADGSIFPAVPLKIDISPERVYLISDGAGGAVFSGFIRNGESTSLRIIFVKADGTILSSADAPTVLKSKSILTERDAIGDGKGNIVFSQSDNGNINVHFYNGKTNSIIPVTDKLGSEFKETQIIQDGAGGFIVVWRYSQGSFAAFVKADGTIRPGLNQPITLTDLKFGEFFLDIISDGAGGSILFFYSRDYLVGKSFVQFIHADGTISGPFSTNGYYYPRSAIPGRVGEAIFFYFSFFLNKIGFVSSTGEIINPKLEILFPNSVKKQTFIRGDADNTGKLDLADALTILNNLFFAGKMTCQDAADIDDNGILNIADAIYLLQRLYQGGAAIPAPNTIGEDPTQDNLQCSCYGTTCA